MTTIDAKMYDLHVQWSIEDDAFIATVTESPSLAAHADSLAGAIAEIQSVVAFVIEDLEACGEVPEPLSHRKFSGRFNVRVPEALHRELAVEAARKHISMNALVIDKLRRA